MDFGSNLRARAFLLLKMLKKQCKKKKKKKKNANRLSLFCSQKKTNDNRMCTQSPSGHASPSGSDASIQQKKHQMSPSFSLARQAAIILLQNITLRMLSSKTSMKNTLK